MSRNRFLCFHPHPKYTQSRDLVSSVHLNVSLCQLEVVSLLPIASVPGSRLRSGRTSFRQGLIEPSQAYLPPGGQSNTMKLAKLSDTSLSVVDGQDM
jgi:hypothetical protein